MKILLLAMSLSIPLLALAEQNEEIFNQQKTKMINHLDQRVEKLNKAKGCYQGSKNTNELQECRKTLRADMKGLKEDMGEDRKEFKALRKDLREKKREEMKSKRDEMKKLREEARKKSN